MATLLEQDLRRQVRKRNKEISSNRKKEAKTNKKNLYNLEREVASIKRRIRMGAPPVVSGEDDETKLKRLTKELEALKIKTRTVSMSDYQKDFQLAKSISRQAALDKVRQFHIKSRERLVKTALERVRPARHTAEYNPTRTNARDIIMRPFEGLGPSEKGKPLALKEGDLWPVQFGRGTDPIEGKAPWYRTTNGKIFGEQKLEEMPAHYRDTVIRNNTIKKRNEKIRARRKQIADAKRAAINSYKKSQRPWTAPAGVSRIFSSVPALRPPTDLENRKIQKAKFPDRANPGFRRPGMPSWK